MYEVPLEREVLQCLLLLDNSPPRQKSRVERRKAKVEPPLASVTVETLQLRPKGARGAKTLLYSLLPNRSWFDRYACSDIASVGETLQ